MALEPASIERCLEILAGIVRSDTTLSSEFESSIDTFFRGTPPGAGVNVAETLLAARRHLEWFLVEFHSPSLRGAVAERLEDRYGERVAEIEAQADSDEDTSGLEPALDSLRRSHTGIFEVEEVKTGAGAWLRDLTGFGSFALGDAALSQRLQAHDLVVGRLYPAGDGLNAASPSVAIVRGANVAGALEADLDRMRAEGAAKVMRVSQGELEAMFFGAGAAPAVVHGAEAGSADAPDSDADRPEDPVGEALAIVRELGLDQESAEAVLTEFAREPRDPERLVHGGSDALGRILEELAFETDIDLDAARASLIRAWDFVSLAAETVAPAEPEAPVSEDDDEAARERAIAAFTEGRARGGDAAQLVKTLREDLGLGDESDDEPDRPAPDFPGVVGAMIDEMKWEFGTTQPGFDTGSLEPLGHFAEFARPIGVFEELRGHDLFQFATFWLQEKDALASDAEAVQLVQALRVFCEWALDAHEVDLGSEFLDALDGLELSLPRMRHANAALDASAVEEGARETGERYEIVALDEATPASFEESADRVRSSAGDTLTVVFSAALREHLKVGDHMRGRIALDGTAVVFRCYPPEAAALTPR